MVENDEELQSLLMKVKEESEKVGLKLHIQKTKIMASGPITSWQIDGETVETVSTFIFWAPKALQMVIAAMKLKDTCSLEEKFALLTPGMSLWPPWPPLMFWNIPGDACVPAFLLLLYVSPQKSLPRLCSKCHHREAGGPPGTPSQRGWHIVGGGQGCP